MEHAVACVSKDHSPYQLDHLDDVHLVRELADLVERDRATTALLIAHIAEVDERGLYVEAGYASMFAYCVENLRLSEGAAYRRIRAGRAARQFPALFDAIAEGRLHLGAVSTMAPFLNLENVDRLILAATHRRRVDIEKLLANEFPSSAVESRITVRAVTSIPRPEVSDQLPLQTPYEASSAVPAGGDELAPGRVHNNFKQAPEQIAAQNTTLSDHYRIHVTISGKTLHKLQRATALLSHAVPSGDAAQVMDRALDALIAQLQARKCGARRSRPRKLTGRPKPKSTEARVERTRHIPAAVRRAVWERDGERCTFVSDEGHRCNETHRLEFDHVVPVARGGPATTDGLRLRCCAHNQLEAERVFGSEFMNEKRERSEGVQAIVRGLRTLGCGSGEARRAAEFAWPRAGTLEGRMRIALRSFARTG